MNCDAKTPDLVEFADLAQMDARLAGQISDLLVQAIAQNGRAALALSGGTTPRGLYARLSNADIDWSRVWVTLVDERFVATTHAASNERLVRETLLQNHGASAHFTGLRGNQKAPKEAANAAEENLAGFPHPFDVVVMGMGEDGHTASWFAGSDQLDAALDTKGSRKCISILAPESQITGQHTQRLTLTVSALQNARLCLLLLKGQAKREVYMKASAPGSRADMPVRAIFQAPMEAFLPCWTP